MNILMLMPDIYRWKAGTFMQRRKFKWPKNLQEWQKLVAGDQVNPSLRTVSLQESSTYYILKVMTEKLFQFILLDIVVGNIIDNTSRDQSQCQSRTYYRFISHQQGSFLFLASSCVEVINRKTEILLTVMAGLKFCSMLWTCPIIYRA